MLALNACLLAFLATAAEEPARSTSTGPVGELAGRVTRRWLIEAPRRQPAMLAMLRDRDRTPHRDLLLVGRIRRQVPHGGDAGPASPRGSALRDRLRRFVAELVRLQDADGYLGPFPKDHRLTGNAPNVGPKGGPTWDAWGHYHMMLGLLAWHRETGDRAALSAASKIGDMLCDRFLGDRKPRLVDTGSTEMNLAPAHGLLLLYGRTKEPNNRALAEQIVQEFAAEDPPGNPLAGDYLRRGHTNEPFFKTPSRVGKASIRSRPSLNWQKSTRPLPTSKPSRNLWWSIAGSTATTTADFRRASRRGNPITPGAIETCCTIAWLAMSVDLLELTRNPVVADELELSTLNSGLGMFSPTGRWSTYNADGRRPSCELPRDQLPVPAGLARAELLQRERRERPGPDRRMGRPPRRRRPVPQLLRARLDLREPQGRRLRHFPPGDRVSPQWVDPDRRRARETRDLRGPIENPVLVPEYHRPAQRRADRGH
ncbi:MAG: glycoside hydrolase family 127 protein [Isosphaeraceae bacterium]